MVDVFGAHPVIGAGQIAHGLGRDLRELGRHRPQILLQQFRRIGGRDRDGEQVAHGVDPLDGDLDGNAVVDVIGRIEKKRRGNQHARGERSEQGVRHLPLTHPQQGSAGTIHIHLQGRVIEHLADVDIGGARDLPQIILEPTGKASRNVPDRCPRFAR